VFDIDIDIDIETCRECGGDVRNIASIEDPAIIRKLLTEISLIFSRSI